MAYAVTSAGYDDNVALTSGADVLGVSGTGDVFGELQLALSAPLEGPWRWDASVMLVEYGQLDLFDQAGAAAGGSYRLESGRWTNEIGLTFDHTLLDGEGLENRRALTLKTRTRLPAGWTLRARYRFSDIDGLGDFTGLGGQRHDATVRLARLFGAWEMGCDIELQSAHQDNQAFSVRRSQFSADVQRSLPSRWTIGAQAASRVSRYDLAQDDRETLTELGLFATRELSSRWRLVLRYGFADNDARRPDFTYSRHRLAAAFEATL